ncbi:polysaccharide biosynthesis tyrosine autokinase [Cumulibacter manganitolerans]|uniref:polysaccharide biosynthesis tyrosine autokinase n=1 Tax=Cumulibacter manganitolerans TaxID=1884992 RepID=UPI001294F94A|nr:polysaccharide biosynthesis tyrosine autokinase [Cumulibacter manganitolerans]
MELRDYLRIIRQQWLLIASCVLVAIAAASVFTLRATPQYQSTAALFISTPQSDGSAAYQGSLFSQQRVASYADLIKGKQIAQRVVDKLGLDESAGALASRVSASVVKDTVILNVTVQDSQPQRAQKLAEAIAQEFTVFVSELETTPGSENAPIKATIVDPATVPVSAVSPRPLSSLALAIGLGLIVGVGLAVLREMLDNTVKNTDTLREVSGAANLGSIFYDGKAAARPLVTQLDSHAPRAEAFRVLRTNLQFIDVDSDSKVFIMTSPLPGDGKSTTAVNLAITLAQAGQRTLLIEGDLRRPKTSEYLGLESKVGLTTVLIGKIDLDDVIQPWGDDGLHVISSGAIPPNPAELLQSRQMETVLDRLRRHYDVILIDAPPLLPVADAAVLARQADGAILVVRHGKTTKDQVVAAADRLHSVDAELLGTVFNRTPSKGNTGYGYGYGYGYAPSDDADILADASFTRSKRRAAPADSGQLPAAKPAPEMVAPAHDAVVGDHHIPSRSELGLDGDAAPSAPRAPRRTGQFEQVPTHLQESRDRTRRPQPPTEAASNAPAGPVDRDLQAAGPRGARTGRRSVGDFLSQDPGE